MCAKSKKDLCVPQATRCTLIKKVFETFSAPIDAMTESLTAHTRWLEEGLRNNHGAAIQNSLTRLTNWIRCGQTAESWLKSVTHSEQISAVTECAKLSQDAVVNTFIKVYGIRKSTRRLGLSAWNNTFSQALRCYQAQHFTSWKRTFCPQTLWLGWTAK